MKNRRKMSANLVHCIVDAPEMNVAIDKLDGTVLTASV